MYYCSIHEINHSSYECPRCAAERQHEELLEQVRECHDEDSRLAAVRHEEAMDALRESYEKLANPGDYECPHCRYISLKRYATRCPLCRESPDAEYWDRVEEREERERQRAAAAAEERARRAKIEAEKRAAEALEKERQDQETAANDAARRRSRFVFGLVILAIAGIIAWPFIRQQFAPPEYLIDGGACPYEECRYGELWIARRAGYLYEAPPKVLGEAGATLTKRAAIRAGDRVTTRGGLILAKRAEGIWGGRTVDFYSAYGEGCSKIWVDRAFKTVCDDIQKWPDSAENPQEWWVEVVTKSGVVGWTKGQELFASQDGLNCELSRMIAEPGVALRTRLSHIDALIRAGAQVNESGGKHCVYPQEAITESPDVELLNEMMKRGFRIENGKVGCKYHCCTAYWMSRSALKPGGDEMLEALLANGMRLNCLSSSGPEAVLPAFLSAGIDQDNYPVDHAIRIAEILVRHGADVEQRGSDGKSMLNLLDKSISRNPKLVRLREALSKLPDSKSGE